MKKLRSSSLKIGKVINQELNDIIQVFPIVAPVKTSFPFAVYKRNGLSVKNTKDIYNFEETATIEIVVASNGYDEGLNIATNIKMYLEHLKGEYKTSKEEQINIEDVTMIDASEDWQNDAFLQSMTFEITITNEPQF